MKQDMDKELENLLLDDVDFGEETIADLAATERFSAQTKIFLHNLNIRPSALSKRTMVTLSGSMSLPIPKKGEQLRIRTQTQLSMLAIVLNIIEKYDFVDELTIATYTFNHEAYSILTKLLTEGRIGKLSLLLASSISFRDKKYYQQLKEEAKELSEKKYHLVFAWSHFKITLIRCGDDYFQLEGSMNYSKNNLAENLVFENKRETYEYDHDFIIKTMLQTTAESLEVIC